MQPNRIAIRQSSEAAWKTWTMPAVLGGIALAWFSAGAVCLGVYARGAHASPVLAPAGISLLICAAAQARLIYVGWQWKRLPLSVRLLASPVLWRRALLGAVLAFLATLVIGPLPYAGCAWLAGLAVWQSLWMLPLAASGKALEDWRRWTEARTPRRLGWLVYASLLLLVASETGLRAYRLALGGGWLGSARALVADFDAHQALADEPLGMRVARLQSTSFRVAIVGDTPACDLESRGYLAQVEQSLPGIEIVPLSATLGGPGPEGTYLAAEVEQCGADLVLAVLPVCENLARETVATGCFDWRELEMVRLVLGPRTVDPPAIPTPGSDSFESHLHRLGPQLAACRTPIDDAMGERWTRTFTALDRLIADCRDIRVPVALVIVPGEFQMNHVLRETLLRRNGVSAEAFDVELPQRRLAGYASERQLPLIDLLPHLRLCSEGVYRRHTTELNEHGNSTAASAIGGWLESRYGQQLAAQLSKAP